MSSAPSDLSALSADQQLALQQFTSVTDQDLSDAIPLLQNCQWNAQIAITRFFDGDAETVDPAAEAPVVSPPQRDARRAETLLDSIPSQSPSRTPRRTGLEPAARVVPTPEGQMIQPLPFPLRVVLFPFDLTYTILQRTLGLVGYLFPFLPRLFARIWSGRVSQPSRDTGRRPLNPRDTAARFVREFDEEYGAAPGTLPFHEGGYAQAFDIAKRDLKYLLVVLLSPEHDDTAPFVRETLLSPDFATFVRDSAHNIIMWGGSVRDAEAYQVASGLDITQFPCISLIVHTPSVSPTAMSKTFSSSGLISARDLLVKLEASMRKHNTELESIRASRHEQQATRNLRHEQESAYERSLAQDRAKARKKREEVEAKEQAARSEREHAERKAEHARKQHQWTRWRAQRIREEPPPDDTNSVRISLRLPSGERIVRRFSADVALEELYAFVACRDMLAADQAAASEKEAAHPLDYAHAYGFRLVSPMPREVYDAHGSGTVRQRIGRSGNLIVEKTIDDEEDDDGT